MAEIIPDARLEIFPEGSHTLPIDEPDRINAIVEQFVTEVETVERARR